MTKTQNVFGNYTQDTGFYYQMSEDEERINNNKLTQILFSKKGDERMITMLSSFLFVIGISKVILKKLRGTLHRRDILIASDFVLYGIMLLLLFTKSHNEGLSICGVLLFYGTARNLESFIKQNYSIRRLDVLGHIGLVAVTSLIFKIASCSRILVISMFLIMTVPFVSLAFSHPFKNE